METKSPPDEYQVFDTELQESIAPIEFILDDGTATISVICSPRVRNRGDAELLKVGSIATVIGKIQIQNGCRVVQCLGYSNLLADPPTRRGNPKTNLVDFTSISLTDLISMLILPKKLYIL